MKHDEYGTTIESGDPHFISFRIANCPLCGAVLGSTLATMTGHLQSSFTCIGNISFSACDEHFEEATTVPARHARKKGIPGYYGQWEPRFGLIAEVHVANNDNGSDVRPVRLI